MPYNANAIALTFTNSKRAALFFDHVIPMDWGVDVEMLDFTTPLLPPEVPVEKLAILSLVNLAARIQRQFPDAQTPEEALWRHRQAEERATGEIVSKVLQPGASPGDIVTQGVLTALRLLMAGSTVMIDDTLGPVEKRLVFVGSSGVEDGAESINLVLSNLPTVDMSKVSWELITEIRGDVESRRKLSRLRQTIFDQYDGKPIDFVRDSVERDLEAYREAAKKWGLDTILSSLTVGGVERLTAGAIAASTGAAAGLPIETAAAIGLTAYFGSIGVSFVSGYRQQLANERFNPVAYIADVQDRAEAAHKGSR
jgi:hypothetical protein